VNGLTIRRLGYALGAEVRNLDLSRELDAETVARVRQAWLDHIVLCFPDQNIGPEQLMNFAARFGTLEDNRNQPYAQHPAFSNVIVHANNPVSINGKRAGGFVGDSWHSDRSYSDRPISASLLAAKKLPDVGGNTMFANQYMAYEALSPAFQRMIEPLSGVHDNGRRLTFLKDTPKDQAERLERRPAVHPVVSVHPETGRKALYISDRVRTFVGMTEDEARPLRDFLIHHAVRYEFVYRHAWSENDLLMWDNRCSLHIAVQDYDHSQLRQMEKCAVRMDSKPGAYYLDREALLQA
jgi:taurine dioxygenase